jgi:2-phosphoglycerate kinase
VRHGRHSHPDRRDHDPRQHAALAVGYLSRLALRDLIAGTAPEPFDPDYGFAYAKGLMARELMTTGLPLDRAWDLARRVEDHLAWRGRHRVSLEELRVLAHNVLGEHEGDETADRFRRWLDFETLERPLVVLIGGGTGVGKSTVATQLAYSLGITRVSSTDFIRQVLRSAVPEAIAPELSRSSFELDNGISRNGSGRHAEFERQARQVLVGVRATIERAVAERMPLIIEGIHLLPELVDADAAPDGLMVYVVLSVEDRHDHWNRFAARGRASERSAGRYQASLERIRNLQDHVVATARRNGTPVLANQQVNTTVRSVLDLIFAAVDEVLPPRETDRARR